MTVACADRCLDLVAPPLVPDVLDHVHLGRMTLGDPRLEREVLQLFVRQTSLLMARIIGGAPAVVVASAHTLSGSARGIGAWRVAHAAERLELAAAGQAPFASAVEDLAAASAEARTAIGELLRDL